MIESQDRDGLHEVGQDNPVIQEEEERRVRVADYLLRWFKAAQETQDEPRPETQAAAHNR